MNPFFIKSASNINDWINDDISEICFTGRSNVGKSSLINALARNKISKTSNTPGRTQLVNFFQFKNFRIIDLPGYGYAKVSKNKKIELDSMIFEYLSLRKNLYAVFQICDCNVITADDVEIANFIKKKFFNHYIILNKLDKQNKSFFHNNKHKIANHLNVDPNRLIAVSAKNGMNINKLYELMNDIIKGK